MNYNMKYVLRFVILAVTIYLISRIVPGFSITSVQPLVTVVIIALVLTLLNIFIKPILKILTLPITIITLGLFSLVINALLLLLVAWIVPGFDIHTFGAAVISSLIISIVHFSLG